MLDVGGNSQKDDKGCLMTLLGGPIKSIRLHLITSHRRTCVYLPQRLASQIPRAWRIDGEPLCEKNSMCTYVHSIIARVYAIMINIWICVCVLIMILDVRRNRPNMLPLQVADSQAD